MPNLKDLSIWVACGLVYLLSALVWEVAIARVVWWWVLQFFTLPPSLFNLSIALVFALVIIPHFLWFPVTLFKELKYLFYEADSAPLTA